MTYRRLVRNERPRQVVTRFRVDGADAVVHGDLPMNRAARKAMTELLRVVVRDMRAGKFDKKKPGSET